jgi:TRAP-type C4-dicarboxylate transport system permease small subunit
MRRFHALARVLAKVADHAVGWLLLLTVALNVAQVFTRYVMNDPLFWTEEAIRYATIWLTFLGSAAASQYGDHMDMNLFLGVRNERFQRFHQIFLNGLTIVFGGLVLWQGTRYCLMNGMQTSPAAGIQMIWIYSATVVGAAFLLVVAVHKLLIAAWPRSAGEDAA